MRIAKWDNAKAILIFLVVLGHFADKYVESSAVARGLFFAIYMFHMPAFFFISGLFSKKNANKDRFAWKEYAPLLPLYFLLNMFRYIWVRKGNADLEFNLFRMTNVAWFLFALFVCYVLVHLLRNVKPYFVLILSVIISCFIGYSDEFGSLFAIYRIANMFPFFYLGYAVDVEKLSDVLEGMWKKVLALVSLAAWFIFCMLKADSIYEYRRLITGANSYQSLPFDVPVYVGAYRLVWIVAAIFLIMCALAIAPKRKLPLITNIGKSSFTIYFWHLLLEEVLVRSGFFKTLIATPEGMLITFIVFSIVIVLILSWKPLSIPTDWVRKPPMKDEA